MDELTPEEVAVAESIPQRVGYYRAKRLMEAYRNAVFKIRPKSQKRKRKQSR